MSVQRGHVRKEVDHFLSLECGGVNVGADTWAVPCCQNCSCVEQFGFAFFGTMGERKESAARNL